MGIGRAPHRYKGKDFILIHFDGLTRRQIIRYNDHRFVRLYAVFRYAGKNPDDSCGYIFDIGRSCFHILVIH